MAIEKAVIKKCAREAGFDLAGVASAEPFLAARTIALERLGQGLMGGMAWYTEARVLRGTEPQAILPGVRSIISMAVSYHRHPGQLQPMHGQVARYAWGRDYHNMLKQRCKQFVRLLEKEVGATFAHKAYVDDGPMLDREVARRAGVGFTGKNTNSLTKIGSWTFLAQVLTDLEIAPDKPQAKSCGTCTACMPACPTGAITAPYVLDSNKCIAYLTIEHRGPIDRALRPLMGSWVFGCDICQDVCPVNHKLAKPTSGSALSTENASLDLIGLLEMTEEEFNAKFQGTPIRRAKHAGMQRNACIALGNMRDAKAVTPLARALRDAAPLVRGHAAWALGRIGTPDALQVLVEAQVSETDTSVREEIALALSVP